MKSSHTKGPWIIRDRTGTIGNPALGIEGPGAEVIASVIYQDGFDALQANARLIAAAPELLEACKFILSQLDQTANGSQIQCKLYSDCLAPDSTDDDKTVVDYLREIVTKAEGK